MIHDNNITRILSSSLNARVNAATLHFCSFYLLTHDSKTKFRYFSEHIYTDTYTHTHTHTNRNYCGEKKKKEKEGENKEKKKKMKTSAQGHNMSSPHSSHAHTLVIGTDAEVTQQSHQHILTHRVVSHKEKKKGRQRTETKSRKKKEREKRESN